MINKRFCKMNFFKFLILLFSINSYFIEASDRQTVREQCKKSTFTNSVWKLRIDLFDAIDGSEYLEGEEGGRYGSSFYILEFANNGLLKKLKDGYDYSIYASNYVTNDETEDIVAYPKVDGENYSQLETNKVENRKVCELSLTLLVKHFVTGQDGIQKLHSGVDFSGSGYLSGYQLETEEPHIINLDHSFVKLYNDVLNDCLTVNCQPYDVWSNQRRAIATLTRLYYKSGNSL